MVRQIKSLNESHASPPRLIAALGTCALLVLLATQPALAQART